MGSNPGALQYKVIGKINPSRAIWLTTSAFSAQIGHEAKEFVTFAGFQFVDTTKLVRAEQKDPNIEK